MSLTSLSSTTSPNDPLVSGGQPRPLGRDTDPIYFDAGALLDKHLTGIGRFATRMIEAVARIRPVCLFTTISLDVARSLKLTHAPHWGTEILITPADVQRLPPIDADVQDWARAVMDLPRRQTDLSLTARCAVVYPLLRPLFRCFRTEIGVFHDFTPSLLPWAHSPTTIHHFNSLFTIAAPLFDSVIANSKSTKADARWMTTLSNDRITTCYPGPSLCDHKHSHQGPVTRAKVILAVSALEPRKNGPFLLEWFLKTKAIEPGTELWWVGARGWWTEGGHIDELKHLAETSTDRKIRFLGSVPDSELCRLYQSSMVTIYPSLYEGFGFPVLDSLMHGTFVLASYHSSLQEFNLPGVFFFDACDKASVDVAYKNFLVGRNSIKIDESELRRRFSWDQMARTVLELAK